MKYLNHEVIQFLLNTSNMGGVGTSQIYDMGFSVTAINACIRHMIEEGTIEITCSSCGFRITNLEGWNKKGCEISLRKKDYAIYHTKQYLDNLSDAQH